MARSARFEVKISSSTNVQSSAIQWRFDSVFGMPSILGPLVLGPLTDSVDSIVRHKSQHSIEKVSHPLNFRSTTGVQSHDLVRSFFPSAQTGRQFVPY